MEKLRIKPAYFLKLSLIWIVTEVTLFIILIFFSMSDEGLSTAESMVSTVIYNLLKYGFGFPMVFINHTWPFLIDSHKASFIKIVVLVLTNNTLQISIVLLAGFWIRQSKNK